MITASDLELRAGSRILLSEATLRVQPGDRIGLVGRNGSGKTTFLKILAGLVDPISGSVVRRRDLAISYLSQDFTLDTIPTELEGVYEVKLHIVRVSGDVSNWKRINRRFLNVTRKQFLIWRTLNAEEQERYMEDTPGAPADTDVSAVAIDSGAVAPAL